MTNVATMDIVVDLKDNASKQLNAFNKQVTSSGAKMGAFAKKAALIGGAAGIGGVAIAIKGSVSAFVDFEDAMAGVMKTTGMSGEAIKELGDGIKELSGSIPLAQTELADIAAVAGQLGIQGSEAILEFTETAAKMATAFDMPAEKAATVAAKLTNVYGLGIEQASNLASAINVLGNTTAASEGQISDYAMSLGASAVQMGFNSTEAVAMGATLISMGMDASDAGTRLNSAFTTMGAKSVEVSGFLGITQEAFSKAFGDDPMGMVIQITEKLGGIADPLERSTVASELFGRVGAKAINGLGGNLDGLKTNLDNAAKGFEENVSLQEEFAAKTDTLKATFTLLGNAIKGAAITMGTGLAPIIEAIAEKFTAMVPVIMDIGGQIQETLGPAFASIGGHLKDIIPKIKDFVTAFGTKLTPAFESIKKIVGSLGEIFGNLIGHVGDSEAAFTSLTSIGNTVADLLNGIAGAVEAVVTWFAKHPTMTNFAIALGAAIAIINTPILAIIAAVALLAIAWDQDWGGIKTVTLAVTGAIADIISGFIDVVTGLWEDYGAGILAVVEVAWGAVELYIALVINNITTVINVGMALLKGDWEGAWDALKEGVEVAWEAIDAYIALVIANIATVITAGMAFIKDEWSVEWGYLQAITQTVVDAIQLVIDLFINGVKTTISVGMALLKGDWDGAWDALKEGVATSFGLISGTIDEFIGRIQTVIKVGMALVKGDWSGAWEAVRGKTKESMDAITSETSTGMDAVTSATSTGMDNVVGAVSDGGAKAVSGTATWCGNIVSAIGLGAGGWVTRTAQGMGGVVDAVQSGGGYAVDATNVWTLAAGGVIDSWAASAQASVAEVGRSMDAMNAKWEEQQREANRISERRDVPSENQASTPSVAVTGLVIQHADEDAEGSYARGTYNGRKYTGRSQDPLKELLGGDEAWFTESAWARMSDATKASVRSSSRGVVSDDYMTIIEDFSVSASTSSSSSSSTSSRRTNRPTGSDPANPYAPEVNQSEGLKMLMALRDAEATGLNPDVSYDRGGPVPSDMIANLHEGEYVIPKHGALVKANGGADINITNNYNIGTIYGVDDLNKVLEAHDRELVRMFKGVM